MSEVIEATYVDQSTFVTTGDLRHVFRVDRRLRAEIGEDDKPKSHITGASYDSGSDETSVNLYDDILTDSLDWVQVGVHSSGQDGGLPLHDHSSDEQGGEVKSQQITSGIIDTRIGQDEDGEDLHVELHISSNRDFSSPVIEVFSESDQSGWYYHDGAKYESIPSDGVPWGSSPTTVAYEWDNVEITRGTRYYVQWRTYDGDNYSNWFSETRVW